MNRKSTQQEIMVFTGTGFASRQFSERDSSSKIPGGNEQLKDACWNGLIKEMLPEAFNLPGSGNQLYLWQVREANQFIALEMSQYPTGVDKYLSIDPYRFMEIVEYN